MQTFLPYSDFAESAKVLDNKRLGKQRVEVKQILLTLKNGGGWIHHPAVKMWRNHEHFLGIYGFVICTEWIKRGFKDRQLQEILNLSCEFPLGKKIPWFGDERFHSSHRSNLLRKKPEWYGQFGWKETNNLPYYWPVR